ncbi:hypothetical protein [Bradyrhizobium sp. 170]|nr:hypothetical protein [Bradyrhizobium sp. 170]
MADVTMEPMFKVLKSVQVVGHEGHLDLIERRLELNDAPTL